MNLSVIIPTCGRNTLENTVKSALMNLREGDELIVVGPRRPEGEGFVWLEYDNGGCRPDNWPLTTLPGYPSGAPERDAGRAIAKGTHIAVCDDDDIFMPGAFEYVHRDIEAEPTAVHIYRVTAGYASWCLWHKPVLELGQAGGPMCVVPNSPLYHWEGSGDGQVPGGCAVNESEDFFSVLNYVKATGCAVRFHEEIIGVIRPNRDDLKKYLGVDVEPFYHGERRRNGGW